jgi:hypothetical protein
MRNSVAARAWHHWLPRRPWAEASSPTMQGNIKRMFLEGMARKPGAPPTSPTSTGGAGAAAAAAAAAADAGAAAAAAAAPHGQHGHQVVSSSTGEAPRPAKRRRARQASLEHMVQRAPCPLLPSPAVPARRDPEEERRPSISEQFEAADLRWATTRPSITGGRLVLGGVPVAQLHDRATGAAVVDGGGSSGCLPGQYWQRLPCKEVPQ